MPVEQVASLLDRWRQADGMFARGRVLTEAVRLLRELTPDERRTLARALAERGSPELAAQFEGSFGGALEADEVRRIAEQLLYLDDDELAALVADLRDPDQRRQLATEAVDRAFALDGGLGVVDDDLGVVDDGLGVVDGAPTSPPPGGSPHAGPPPPPGAAHATDPGDADSGSGRDADSGGGRDADSGGDPGGLDAAAAEARETVEQQRARLQELADADDDLELEDLTLTSQDLGDQPLGSQPLGAVALGGVALGSADLVEADLVDVGLGPAAEPTPDERGSAGETPASATPAPDPRPRDEGVSGSDDVAAGDDDAPHPGDPVGDQPVPTTDGLAPVAVGSPGDANRDLREQVHDVTDPADAVCATLLDRVATTDRALTRLQLLDDARLGDLDADAALRVLDAYPDGWQRRRAAVRLLDAGALRGVAADDLVHCFARTGDAAFVAGGLVDAGQLDADTLDGLLPRATVTRLRHRQER